MMTWSRDAGHYVSPTSPFELRLSNLHGYRGTEPLQHGVELI